MADLDLLYREARAQLDIQIAAYDALDVKVGIALASAGAEAALAVGALAFPRPASTAAWLIGAAAAFTVVVLAAFAYLVRTSIGALSTARLDIGPRLNWLEERYDAGEADVAVKWRAVNALKEAFTRNQDLYAPKVVALRRLLRILLVQTVATLLVLALLAAPSLSRSFGWGLG